MLGIAAKSGSVVSGEFSTEKAVKDRKGMACDCRVGFVREYKEAFSGI